MRKKGIIISVVFIVVGLCLMGAGGRMGAQRRLNVNMLGQRFTISSGLFQRHDYHNSDSYGENVSSVSADLNAFDKIVVDVVNMDVILTRGETYYIEMFYDADRDIRWEQKNGTLRIEDKSNGELHLSVMDVEKSLVTIYCPETMLDSIKAETVSGSIQIDSCSAESMKLNSISGSILIGGCKAEKIDAETVSGAIEINSAGCADIEIDSVSGSIDIVSTVSMDEYDIEASSVSGSFKINNESVSRSERKHLRSKDADYSLDVETVSGSIALYD